jgi:hypothetical protein
MDRAYSWNMLQETRISAVYASAIMELQIPALVRSPEPVCPAPAYHAHALRSSGSAHKGSARHRFIILCQEYGMHVSRVASPAGEGAGLEAKWAHDTLWPSLLPGKSPAAFTAPDHYAKMHSTLALVSCCPLRKFPAEMRLCMRNAEAQASIELDHAQGAVQRCGSLPLPSHNCHSLLGSFCSQIVIKLRSPSMQI